MTNLSRSFVQWSGPSPVRANTDGRLQPGELARVTNAAARLFEVCQAGALVLQRLKTGGTQRVVVQYQQRVNVSRGGQAVVAQMLKRGAKGKRARGKPK